MKTGVIILAAGKGSRMHSEKPKVLHEIAGLPMLGHVLRAVQNAQIEALACVMAPGQQEIASFVDSHVENAEIYLQNERNGTAHALSMAGEFYRKEALDQLLVIYGDMPLVRADGLRELVMRIEQGADLVIAGFKAENPHGYGRIVMNNGAPEAIVEEKDANEIQRAIHFCHSGLMAVRRTYMDDLLQAVDNHNAAGEYYLTDLVRLAGERGLEVAATEIDEKDILGVNDRIQLAEAQSVMQQRLRAQIMSQGVTMLEPSSVYLSYDTQIGCDSIIEPHVHFLPGVVIEKNCHIRSFSYLEQCHVGARAVIGPYARLRPGSDLQEGVKVGNFVEIKNSHIETNAKVPHLSYVGDATVGKEANIGAGTITCNYNGYEKHSTHIGKGAFIGSNTSLVAPVEVGDYAIIGAGSVIAGDNVHNADLVTTRAKRKTVTAGAKKQHARLSARSGKKNKYDEN